MGIHRSDMLDKCFFLFFRIICIYIALPGYERDFRVGYDFPFIRIEDHGIWLKAFAFIIFDNIAGVITNELLKHKFATFLHSTAGKDGFQQKLTPVSLFLHIRLKGIGKVISFLSYFITGIHQPADFCFEGMAFLAFVTIHFFDFFLEICQLFP